MAYDKGLVELIHGDLADSGPLREVRMFGGLCLMLNGNMLCGVHPGGAMYRVGKNNAAAALALPGVREMDFTGRPMAGFVDASDEAMADDDIRAELTRLALDYVGNLPAK